MNFESSDNRKTRKPSKSNLNFCNPKFVCFEYTLLKKVFEGGEKLSVSSSDLEFLKTQLLKQDFK